MRIHINLDLYRKLDWSKTNAQLCLENGFNPRQVAKIRSLLGLSPRKRGRISRNGITEEVIHRKYNWDWNKTDTQLSTEHNLSRERIRQVRKMLGFPPSTGNRGLQTKTLERIKKIKELSDKYSKKEISEIINTHQYTISTICKNFKIKCKKNITRNKHPWKLMNFRLPNTDLEKIWRTSQNAVGVYRCHTSDNRYRLKTTLVPIVYDKKFGIPFSPEIQLNYEKEILEENIKAQKFFEEYKDNPDVILNYI